MCFVNLAKDNTAILKIFDLIKINIKNKDKINSGGQNIKFGRTSLFYK